MKLRKRKALMEIIAVLLLIALAVAIIIAFMPGLQAWLMGLWERPAIDSAGSSIRLDYYRDVVNIIATVHNVGTKDLHVQRIVIVTDPISEITFNPTRLAIGAASYGGHLSVSEPGRVVGTDVFLPTGTSLSVTFYNVPNGGRFAVRTYTMSVYTDAGILSTEITATAL